MMRNDPTEVGQSGFPKSAAHEHHLRWVRHRLRPHDAQPRPGDGDELSCRILRGRQLCGAKRADLAIVGLLRRRPAQSFFAALPDSWLARWRNMCEYMMYEPGTYVASRPNST
jgi:hypothetical protein